MTAVERVQLEPGYVLHGRAYRETSELLEVFTRTHGRISLVAKGMRRRGAGLRAILQPFQPLALSWSGRGGGLMTLRAAEAAGAAIPLQGAPLMSAFYVNELVIRFLHRGDPHPGLFDAYSETLRRLGSDGTPDRALRRFELALLAESGYGLNLDHDAVSGQPLDPGRRYRYVIERGPVPVETAEAGDVTYSGAELLAIGSEELDAPNLQSARLLLRNVLDHYLGGRPLRTREVFSAMKR